MFIQSGRQYIQTRANTIGLYKQLLYNSLYKPKRTRDTNHGFIQTLLSTFGLGMRLRSLTVGLYKPCVVTQVQTVGYTNCNKRYPQAGTRGWWFMFIQTGRQYIQTQQRREYNRFIQTAVMQQFI